MLMSSLVALALTCPFCTGLARVGGVQDAGTRICMVAWPHGSCFCFFVSFLFLIVPHILFSLPIVPEY